MDAIATMHTFDTLEYMQALIAAGIDAKQAETLAKVNKTFIIDELVTRENLKQELGVALLAQEIRILKTIGAMFVVAVTILLAGIPILLKFLE